MRYDLKDAAVRARHGLRPGDPLNPELHAEVENVAVSDAAIDSLVTELKPMPTFRYYAGGEITYRIAWSEAEQRFIRIFSCC